MAQVLYLLYPASAALSATLICSVIKMAPLPPDDSSRRHADSSTANEASMTTPSSTTPPARPPNSNEGNPFVQFRRFADSQISSLLQSVIGLPSLFERPSPNARWIVIKTDSNGNEVYVKGDKETMRHRKQLEEGWRKQREQELEEQKRECEMDTEEHTIEVKRSPALNDSTATEAADVGLRYPNGDPMPARKSGGVFSWLGWDGKQKQEGGAGHRPDEAQSRYEGDPPGIDSSTSFSGNGLDIMPWLVSNEYSPIFLRGHLPKDITPGSSSFLHALHHPHWPDFRAASSPDRFEKELRFKVPWCDAFEDLISLQYNGYMVDRDEPTRTSSAQWIKDMVQRGSLGPHYASMWSVTGGRLQDHPPALDVEDSPSYTGHGTQSLESSHRMTTQDDLPEPDPVLTAVALLRGAVDDTDWEDECMGYSKHWRQEIDDELRRAVVKDLALPGVIDRLQRLGFVSERQVIDYLLGGGDLETPPDVVAAAMRKASASQARQQYVEEEDDEDEDFDDELSQYEQHLNSLDKQTQSRLLTDFPDGLPWSPFGYFLLHRVPVSDELDYDTTAADMLEAWRRMSDADRHSWEQAYNERMKEYKQIIDESADPSSSALRGAAQFLDLAESQNEHTITSASSSTSSLSRRVAEDEKKDSIVSTMTTTETRTLPDGTVETKRVLKKRFADGREESNEKVERQIAQSSKAQSTAVKPIVATKILESEARMDQQTQMSTEPETPRRSNGWFWK